MNRHRSPEKQQLMDAARRVHEMELERQSEMRIGEKRGRYMRYQFNEEELHDLIDTLLSALNAAADHLPDSRLQRKIDSLLDRFENDGFFESED